MPTRSAIFLETLGDPRQDGETCARLETELDEALAAARAACPACAVEEDAFLRHLARHIGRSALDPNWHHEVRVDHLLLAFACANGCPAASRVLREKVDPAIAAAARKVDSAPSFVDEVRQRVFEKLLVTLPDRPARILAYSGRGAIEAWVRVTAARVAIDLVRQRKGAEAASDDPWIDDLDPGSDDPELQYIRLRYADEVNAAYREAFHTLSARERTILRLHLLDGLNIDRIGTLYQVHRATVARWIARARETLVRESHRALQVRLGATDSEVESLERLVKSELHVCLSEVLASSKRDGTD